MSSLSDFAAITRANVPLAPLTWLKVGGPAQRLIEPRSVDELQAVIRSCFDENIPVRVLGGGSNLLIRDEGVSGVVIRLAGEPFEFVKVSGTIVRAGSGALLSHVVSRSVEAGLAGLETLVGIPGTVGGAVAATPAAAAAISATSRRLSLSSPARGSASCGRERN